MSENFTPERTPLDRNAVAEKLAEIVARDPDHVYERVPIGSDTGCAYAVPTTDDGALVGSCIWGRFAETVWGPEVLARLHEVGDASPVKSSYAVDTDQVIDALGVDPRDHRLHRAMRAAQERQDNGYTDGEALAAFEREMLGALPVGA
jgi:hypothetical protein